MAMQAQRHTAIVNVLNEFRLLLSDRVPTLNPVDITETRNEWNSRRGVYLLSDTRNNESYEWRYIGVATVNLYNRLYVAGYGKNKHGDWVEKFKFKWIDFIPLDLSILSLALEALLIVRLQPTENKEFKGWVIPPLAQALNQDQDGHST